jgi:hypothetical protein
MSLKDQVRWLLERPGRWLSGPVRVDAPYDTLGDSVREMANEYNRALRFVLRQSLGAAGAVAMLLRRGAALDPGRIDYALLQAERLAAMLAHTRAAEALAGHAAASAGRRRLAERFVNRSAPLVAMHGRIVRGGDRSTLEALRA